MMRTETDVQNLVRQIIQEHGGCVWRNNVGALPRPDGVPVRFGLANDSAKINKVFKTGDLVGLFPVKGLGAVFLMLECKEPGWRYSGDAHERAQLAAIIYVRGMGGRAGFVSEPAHALQIAYGIGLGAPHA